MDCFPPPALRQPCPVLLGKGASLLLSSLEGHLAGVGLLSPWTGNPDSGMGGPRQRDQALPLFPGRGARGSWGSQGSWADCLLSDPPGVEGWG